MIIAFFLVFTASILLRWDRHGYRADAGGTAWLVSALASVALFSVPKFFAHDTIAVGFSTFVIVALLIPIVEETCRAWGVRRVLQKNAKGVFGYGLFWAFLELWVNASARILPNISETAPSDFMGWLWSWPPIEMSIVALSSILIHPVNTLIFARAARPWQLLFFAISLHAIHNLVGLFYVAGDVPWWGAIIMRLILLAGVVLFLRLNVRFRYDFPDTA